MGRKNLLSGAALTALTLLSACGGGGGPISTPAPPQAPTPSPTPTPEPTPTPVPTPTPSPTPAPPSSPTPAPVPSQFNTSEFRRSDGPLQHNAATAWASGWTGQGVTIAVVDRYGNPRATALPTVSLEIDGPATLVGEPLVDLDRIGAIAAVWIRSQADRTGRVTIRAAAPGFGAGAAVVDMTPTRRSGVDERG